MMKLKNGDRVEVVEAYGENAHKLGCVGVVVKPGHNDFTGRRYPLVIEWKKWDGDGVRSVVTKDGWMYLHKTPNNFRFAVINEFEGNV